MNDFARMLNLRTAVIELDGGPIWMLHVRFGSKADMCSAQAHVRFTPRKRHQMRHSGMSALGQKRTFGGAVAMSAKTWPVVGEWLPRLQLNQPPKARTGIGLTREWLPLSIRGGSPISGQAEGTEVRQSEDQPPIEPAAQ